LPITNTYSTSYLFDGLCEFAPSTVREARKTNFPIGREIGSGSYRTVYTLKGFPDLVIKFPESHFDSKSIGTYPQFQQPQFKSPEAHIEAEMDNIKIINSTARYAVLRPHIPTIYFYDPVTHVQVAKRYRPTPAGSYKFTKPLTELFEKTLRLREPKDYRYAGSDFAFSNIMLDENDRLIVVDLGYVRLGKR